jgi:hypothetical protein
MRRGWVLLAAILAGCGAGDPAASKLAEGQQAEVFGKLGWASLYMERGPETGGPTLTNATRVQVLDDKEADELSGHPARSVRVVVLDGEHKGKAGTVLRENLRPVAK